MAAPLKRRIVEVRRARVSIRSGNDCRDATHGSKGEWITVATSAYEAGNGRSRSKGADVNLLMSKGREAAAHAR